MQSNKPKSQKPDVYPKIYLFGDSLTERSFEAETGFGKVLTDYYAGKAQVMDIGERPHLRGFVRSDNGPDWQVFLGRNPYSRY